jgi:predicted nuclease of predicted toxin-antitoxin system
LAAAVRLYLDENLNPAIAAQLRLRGIDAICARDLGTLGSSDPEQFELAQTMGCVIVTSDTDFLRMASVTTEHFGIIFGRQQNRSIGDWVKGLERICVNHDMADLANQITYL